MAPEGDRLPRTTPALLILALGYATLQLASGWIPPWELFHDELYYWVGSRRLELGYVDHPPLSPWLLAGVVATLGEGRLAFGLPPALCGATTVFLTGAMARRLRADTFGQLVAALGAAVAPVLLVFFSFYSVNAIEILLWTSVCFLLLELIRSGDERLWLAIGAVAGLGLLNKHTFGLIGFGIAIGVLATPLRTQLESRWLWLGAGLALLLAAPNLWWNFQNDWPSLDFYQSRGGMNLPTSLADSVLLQIVSMNPANLLLWVPGLLFLLVSRTGRRYRPLGIAFLVLLLLMLFSGLRRGDRIAGAYPMVLAAGGAFWAGWQGRGYRLVRGALLVLLLAGGALVLPATLPVVSPARVVAFFEWIGEKPDVEKADVGNPLPVFLMGRLGWERLADEAIAAWETVPAAERARAVILAPHWLYASVIAYYGREHALPPIVSPHNAYAFWRHDAAGRDVVLSVGIREEVLARHFRETRRLHVFRCEHCASWRPDLPISVSYGPPKPLPDLLWDWRHFGLERAPALVADD
jgi:hypothetical protein